jgi:hypothetical protein
MNKFFVLCSILLILLTKTSFSQHFIGMSKEDIKKEMRENKREFYFVKEVNTGKYHFLKYENLDETKTKLFLLSEDEKCKYTKLMCDYSLLKSFEDSLNRAYEYQKNLKWIDYNEESGNNYLLELEKKKWFFTIKTSKIKD